MIKAFLGNSPLIHETAFVAETANVIGRVTIGENSSIWYNTVLRGDRNYIEVGKNTSIQDNSVVHISFKYPTIIGSYVTIGHNVVVHACKIGDHALIGVGSIIMDGAEVGSDAIIGAGSLIPKEYKIPSGVLAYGSPVKVIRKLTEEEKKHIRNSADKYVNYGRDHKK